MKVNTIICSLTVLLPLLWDLSIADLSRAEKQAILDNHNFFRSQLATKGLSGQPKPSNLMLLEWDDLLAEESLKHASKCAWHHDVPELPGYGQLGQNMATRGGPRYAIDGVNDWFQEYKFYDYKLNSCQGGKKCGHYKEMMYHTVSRIGCAYVNCRGKSQGRLPLDNFMVCNYDAIVMKGNHLYTPGKPCSNCPGHHTKGCDKGLCVAHTPHVNRHGVESRVPDALMTDSGEAMIPAGGCRDELSSRHCKTWKRKKYCKKSSKHFHKAKDACKKTCKLC